MIKKNVRDFRNSLSRRIQYVIQSYKSYRSLKNIEKDLPEFQEVINGIQVFNKKLKSDHEYYTKELSSEEMAISLEQSSFLSAFFDVYKPEKVLDLGSGFSSFVFRGFPFSEVTSVDDNKFWLDKTKDFLISKGKSFEDLIYWEDFNDKGKYDLVFHDLGSMQTREKSFHRIMNLVKPGGYLFLDDVQKRFYRKHVWKTLDFSNFNLYNLYNLTSDKYGRYMYLCVKGS